METKTNSARATKKVKPVPKGMRTVTPFLRVSNAKGLIKFLKKAFDGELTYIMEVEGQVMHATVKIGDSVIMITDVMDNQEIMPAQLYLYLEDVDAVYKKTLKAGATSMREPLTEFYGDRSAGLKDEWGNQWWIATHVEDVSDAEIKKREKEWRKTQGGPAEAKSKKQGATS